MIGFLRFNSTIIQNPKDGVLKSDLPSNYHLTFSRSETTPIKDIREVLDKGKNVAVVFDHLPVDESGFSFEPLSLLNPSITGANDRAINGDLTDLRFLDECLDLQGNPIKKVLWFVYLPRAKLKDQSGFVVPFK